MNLPFRKTLSGFGRSRAGRAAGLTTAAVLTVGWLTAPVNPRSQAAPPPAAAAPAISVEALNALLGQLHRQQDQMAANQTKIETQTAALKEELRQVKIYSARAGAKR